MSTSKLQKVTENLIISSKHVQNQMNARYYLTKQKTFLYILNSFTETIMISMSVTNNSTDQDQNICKRINNVSYWKFQEFMPLSVLQYYPEDDGVTTIRIHSYFPLQNGSPRLYHSNFNLTRRTLDKNIKKLEISKNMSIFQKKNDILKQLNKNVT